MKLIPTVLIIGYGLLMYRLIRNVWPGRKQRSASDDSGGDGGWLDFLPSFGGGDGDSSDGGSDGGGDGGGGDGGGD